MSFSLESDIVEHNRKTFPSIAQQIIQAKQFLKKQSSSSGDSIYEHLVELVQKILDSKPENIIDSFEDFSKEHKEEKFKFLLDRLQDEYIPSDNVKDLLELYKKYKELGLKTEVELDADENEEKHEEKDFNAESESEAEIPNIMESNYYFQLAGFGLSDYEMFNVTISLRKLVSTKPITKIRFFGKIFGTCKNYYIAETELTEEGLENRNKELLKRDLFPEEEKSEQEEEGNTEKQPEPPINKEEILEPGEDGHKAEEEKSGDSFSFVVLPPLPVSKWEPPVEIPPEKPGEGCNKKVYWVCNRLGDEWIYLPDTTPHYIQVARNLAKYMTGNLETEIHTYPPFYGRECDYLRAQIARIAAATAVSPIEYYVKGMEGEEIEGEEEIEPEEDEKAFTDIKRNRHYEGHTIENLTDSMMGFWVHHGLHILKQGRTSWWNPKRGEMEVEGEGDDHDEEEEGEAGSTAGTVIAEEGPRLLSPLVEDKALKDSSPWSLRPACLLAPGMALAGLESRLWPGAAAYATTSGKSDYIYIGWGVKYLPDGYSPPPLPPVCEEYPLGPEIMECPDPTVDEEEAFRIAHLPPLLIEIPGEGDEDEGNEGEEGEDDEED